MTDPSGYRQALRAIWDRSNYDRGFITNPFAGDDVARLGLRRTDALLDRLGRPDAASPILHVAGSKGKGSTCAFAEGILGAAGLRVGLTTSPHLHSFRERIAVDSQPISEPAFAELAARVVEIAEHVEADQPELGRVTAFELLIAMALDHFAAGGCDAVVLEVGLGGTLDATNVVTPAATAITTLDYEHTEILGPTMAEIAANKAGIVKPGVPLATAALPDEAMAVVADAVDRTRARWLRAGREWRTEGDWREFAAIGPWGELGGLRSGLAGGHQVANAGLAVAATWLGFPGAITADAVRSGLAATRWPGRFEVVRQGNATIVLDGAHTPGAAAALAVAIEDEFPDRRATVVLGVLAGKAPAEMAHALTPVANRFVTVTPPVPRGLAAAQLASAIVPAGRPVATAGSLPEAIAGGGDLVVITGSLATVAAAREALGLAVPDPPPAAA